MTVDRIIHRRHKDVAVKAKRPGGNPGIAVVEQSAAGPSVTRGALTCPL
jgi:hypothetical protein